MCGTMNDQSAQSCTFCGYLFEDYGTGTVSATPAKSEANLKVDQNLNTVPPSTSEGVNPGSYASTPVSTGTALYVVKKSLLTSIVPALIYLFFIGSVGLFSGYDLYSILLVVFLVLVAVVPALFAPRRFEFYDDSMKIHKIVGKESEISYSNLTLLDYPARGRGQQVVLSAAGQRRPLVIGKNPTNQSLGMDLKQFLNSKLKKPLPPGNSDAKSSQESESSKAGDSPQL